MTSLAVYLCLMAEVTFKDGCLGDLAYTSKTTRILIVPFRF